MFDAEETEYQYWSNDTVMQMSVRGPEFVVGSVKRTEQQEREEGKRQRKEAEQEQTGRSRETERPTNVTTH